MAITGTISSDNEQVGNVTCFKLEFAAWKYGKARTPAPSFSESCWAARAQ